MASLILVLALSGWPLSPARAAIRTWDCGAGGSGEWSDPRNWQGDVAPQAGDTLVFPPGAACLSCYDDFAYPPPVFHQLLITGNGYSISDSTSLSGGIIANRADSTNQAPILHLSADQTIECSEASSELRLWRIYPGSHVVTIHAVGDVWMRDGLSDNVGDTPTLIKTGPGTLRWQGYADRDGPRGLTFQLNAGTLVLSNANELRSYPALAGTVIIGDGVGGALSDVVELGTSNQISGDVTINSSGLLFLNNFNNEANPGYSGMMGSLTLRGGSVAMGTGTLAVQNHITTLAASRTATLNGKLRLWIHNNYDQISVADGTANPDLIIYGSIIQASWGVRKLGPGSLTLAGANTFDPYDIFRVDEGTLTLSHDGALGTSNIYTLVTNAARVVIDGVDLGPARLDFGSTEPLTAYGPASWTGTMDFRSGSMISVPSGTFDLRGPAGFDRLTKTGNGTLRLSSSAVGTLDGALTVTAGSVELGLTSGGTFSGVLTLGDGTGGVEVDVVRLVANNQLNTAADIIINSSGLLDLNGYSDLLGPLTFNGGRMQTGTGTATLQYGVTVNSSSAAQARMAGQLSVPGTRTFTVASGPFSPDLLVTAEIRGNGGLTKTGTGEMSLAGSNSYHGLVTVSTGTLDVDHVWALGSVTYGTVVEDGAVLTLRYGVAIGEEALTVSGVGSGSGALRSVGGSNAWAGPVTLEGDTTIQVQLSGDALNLGRAIGGPGRLTKIGVGTLTFSGPGANTYSGRTVVTAGTLELNKTASNGAIPGDLDVGDGSGGAQADVLRLLRGSQISDARVTVGASGLFDLNGYTEAIGSLSGSGVVDLGDGTLNTGYDGSSTVFSGQITGAGGRLGKYGSGTFTLAGTNTYSGLTTVGSGTLLVNGFQPSSPVQVNSARILGGSGTVGHLTNSGTLAPGASVGMLTCSNLAFAGGSAVLAVELNGSGAGTDYDLVNARGSVNLSNATLQVSVGFAPAEGDRFRIINNDGADAVLGAFSGLPEGAVLTAGDLQLHVSYTGGTGNDVVLTVTNTAALRPVLSIWPTTTNTVVVSWPGPDAGWKLQATTNLATAPVAWTEIPPPYATNTTSLILVEPSPPGHKFYRLHKP
jgi:autotransporter-associated beta strand protein